MRKTFIKKGFRELWAHKAKYALFIIILAMGVSMFNVMFSFMESRELTVDNLYETSNFMDYHIQFQYGITKEKTEAEDILMSSPVRDIITAVEYRLVDDVFINHTVNGESKLTKGKIIGYEYFYATGQEREITVNTPLFFNNNPETFIMSHEESCFLEVGFAQTFDFNKDDQIRFINDGIEYEITIKEIINVPDYFVVRTNDMLFPDPSNLGVCIVPMSIAQQILLQNEHEIFYINDILIRVDSNEDIGVIKENINRAFEKHYIPIEIIEKEDNPARYQLIEDIEGDKQFIGLFPLIIFTVSAIGLFISLRRMVQSHRPQIGVFKALGVPNSTVFLYFLIIGWIVAIAGIALGYLLTFPLNNVFQNMMNEMMVFAEYKYGGSIYYFITSAIITIILCMLCTYLPSLTAVREKPVDVIQKHEGVGTKRKKTHSKKILLTKSFPIPFKIVIRDISRKPVRSLTTIFGVALALAFFLSIVILMDSMLIFLDESKEANNWDYEISVAGFVPINTKDSWIQHKDYIELVDYALRLPVNISHNNIQEESMIFGVSDLSNSFNIGIDFVERNGIYISQYLVEKLQLNESDWIEIEIPVVKGINDFEYQTFQTEILGIHSNPIGLYLYADIDYIYQLSNLTNVSNAFYMHTTTGMIPQEILNDIATTPGVSAVTYISDQEKFIDDMFGLILAMIVMMVLIAAVLMTAIIYNISMINVSEKSREYATMKTLGTSLRRITYLILIEGFFTLIGSIIGGSILGYYMAVGMISGTEVLEGFTFEIIFSTQWFLVGAGMVISIVLFVSFLALRYINNIIIADVIRERTTG